MPVLLQARMIVYVIWIFFLAIMSFLFIKIQFTVHILHMVGGIHICEKTET